MHKTTLTRRDAVKLIKLIQDANSILVDAIEKDGSTRKATASASTVNELAAVAEVFKGLIDSINIK